MKMPKPPKVPRAIDHERAILDLQQRVAMLEDRLRELEAERRMRVAHDHATPYVCAPVRG